MPMLLVRHGHFSSRDGHPLNENIIAHTSTIPENEKQRATIAANFLHLWWEMVVAQFFTKLLQCKVPEVAACQMIWIGVCNNRSYVTFSYHVPCSLPTDLHWFLLRILLVGAASNRHCSGVFIMQFYFKRIRCVSYITRLYCPAVSGP